jgi:hypothetical protein
MQLPVHVSPFSASFFGHEPLGIPRTPLLAWLSSRSRQALSRYAMRTHQRWMRCSLVLKTQLASAKLKQIATMIERRPAGRNAPAAQDALSSCLFFSTSICDCSCASRRAPNRVGRRLCALRRASPWRLSRQRALRTCRRALNYITTLRGPCQDLSVPISQESGPVAAPDFARLCRL